MYRETQEDYLKYLLFEDSDDCDSRFDSIFRHRVRSDDYMNFYSSAAATSTHHADTSTVDGIDVNDNYHPHSPLYAEPLHVAEEEEDSNNLCENEPPPIHFTDREDRLFKQQQEDEESLSHRLASSVTLVQQQQPQQQPITSEELCELDLTATDSHVAIMQSPAGVYSQSIKQERDMYSHPHFQATAEFLLQQQYQQQQQQQYQHQHDHQHQQQHQHQQHQLQQQLQQQQQQQQQLYQQSYINGDYVQSQMVCYETPLHQQSHYVSSQQYTKQENTHIDVTPFHKQSLSQCSFHPQQMQSQCGYEDQGIQSEETTTEGLDHSGRNGCEYLLDGGSNCAQPSSSYVSIVKIKVPDSFSKQKQQQLLLHESLVNPIHEHLSQESSSSSRIEKKYNKRCSKVAKKQDSSSPALVEEVLLPPVEKSKDAAEEIGILAESIKHCSKKNVVKNIMSSFLTYMNDKKCKVYSKEDQEWIVRLYDVSAGGSQKACSSADGDEELEEIRRKFKRYILQKSLNHYTVRLLILHPNYGQIFRHFLTDPIKRWINNSKVADLSAHVKMIGFFLTCFQDPDVLEELKCHDKKRAHFS